MPCVQLPQAPAAPAAVPVDAVALQAAASAPTSGISIATSTPVAISNPINILGGAYQAGWGLDLGFGRR